VKAFGEPALKAEERDAVVNIVAARTGNSKEEATHIVDNYAQAYKQAIQKVDELKQQSTRCMTESTVDKRSGHKNSH